MKASELLTETMEFYSVPGRRATKEMEGGGIIDTYCVYKTEDERMCAIGRIANEFFNFEHKGSIGNYSGRYEDWKQHLKEEYREITLSALQSLQGFHDMHTHWNNQGGLTEAGLDRYNYLMRNIDNFTN